jgi:hypothetical protein
MIMMGHEDPDEFNARPARFYHIGPFGISERHGALNGPVSLLPRLGSDGKDHVGEWFLGMRDLAPGQAVSLLVQLLEGSTDPLLGKPEKHVTWSYLARDGWMPFLDSDVSDGTRQLLESGIISFAIPRDAVTNNPVMPRGLLWLRASVTEAAAAVCKILSVKAQAMRVTLEMEGIAPDFPDHALPAGAIAKPKSPDARFKKFSQPYPALGGRRDESREMFRLRASARLRHRGRASTLWDYENLVLEAFPQLYRVKCLNHTRVKEVAETGEDNYNEQQPGYVTIVTLPALGNRNDMNPLKPYTPQGLLSEIRDFLKELVTGQLVPDQVNVNVCNPQFEEVSLDFKLKLKPGHTDFNYFRGRLQEEIARYLSPWAYDGIADIRFGGKIPKSALIDFIEDRPYVDFITDVVLKLGAKADAEPQEVEEVAIATTARSILVSAPPKHHGINEYIPTHE